MPPNQTEPDPTSPSVIPVATAPSPAPQFTRATARLASALVISLLAGLVLQVWTMWYLGRLGPEALYVRSIFTPVGFIVLAVTEGLVTTSQVVAGKAAREGRQADALRSAPTFLVVGAVLLAVLALSFAVVSHPSLSVLAVPTAEQHTVTVFVATVCVASAAGLVPAVAGAAVRGVGRTWIAAALGGGSMRDVLGPILVYATSLISVSIILSAGLSFLGLGVTPPEPEWGLMLNSLRQAIYVQPYVAALPGVMIFITSMCFNLMSDGFRSAMDVRLNK